MGYFKVLKLYRALLVVDPGFPAVDPGVDPGFPAARFSPGKNVDFNELKYFVQV